MKYLAMIQARCGSSRLPNKVLKQLAGKPVLQWVVERVKRSSLVDEVMVVTSIEKNNLPLIELCAGMNTRVFVGSEDDVLDRFYQAAKLIQPEYIIRVTADCPMYDWNYLDMALRQLTDDIDYIYDRAESLPDGLDIEIVKFSALKEAWEEADLKSEREHVTLYIKNHASDFKIEDFTCPIHSIGDKRWTLDEDDDYKVISNIYDFFIEQGIEDFTTDQILDYVNEHPAVEAINKGIVRNEGLLRSLQTDEIIVR